MKEFSVSFWGSHPDAGNDDCFYGEDFDTRSEALAAFHDRVDDTGIAHIMLDGPEIHLERESENHSQRKADDMSDWRHEMRMEAAMLHGVDGWNNS